MGRSLVLSLVAVVVSAGLCSEAAAEDIYGHVYGPTDLLTHTRPPMAGAFLFLHRVDAPTPEEDVQLATYSGPDGAYVFSGLTAGFTYMIQRINSSGTDPCPFRMMFIPPGSPPGFTGVPVPGGLLLPPGPPTNIDVVAPDSCVISSPCEEGTVATNVIAVVHFEIDSPVSRWGSEVVYGRTHFDDVDSVGACFDPPYLRLRVDPDVTVEWLESATPHPPFVGPAGALGSAPLSPGDRVRVSVDPDQPALAHVFGLVGPASFEFLFDPGHGATIPMVEFHFQRVFELKGRAFVERGQQNGAFDGSDLPLPGLVVEVFDDFLAPEPAAPVARTTTDELGRYRFIDLPQAYYRIILRTPGPDADPEAVRLASHDSPAPADFAFGEEDCPHLPCATGDVHEVAFDVRIFVGTVDPAAPVVVDAIDLLDGCDGRSRLERVCGSWPHGARGGCARDRDCGVLHGQSGVATVESIDVADGFAAVRIRLTAAGAVFPAGFFGDVSRRLVVSVNSRACSACVRFACEALQPGTQIPSAPLRGRDARCGENTRGDFTVVDLWGWRPWRICVPAGACASESTTLDGGVHRAEFELDLRAPRSCGVGRRKSHRLDVSFECGGLSDRVELAFSGDATPREVTGRGGVLVVTRAWALSDGSWRVRVRLAARDRADGNPGTLPACACRLDARVDDASARARLDFGRIPFATGLLSTQWLNAIDAGCRYVGR